jgi:uncharacterized protein DUF5723
MGLHQGTYTITRLLIFVLALLSTHYAYSQDTTRTDQNPLFIQHFGFEPEFAVISPSSVYDNSIQFGFNQNANSNALSSSFLRKLVYGGFIDESLKDKSRKNLRSDNLAGLRNAASISFHHKINDSSGYRGEWFVEAKNSLLSSITFSDDLFNLVFYGNATFEGENASLANTRIRQLTMNQVQGGWYGRFYNQQDRFFGLGIKAGLVMGSQMGDFDLDGNLFTAPEGRYIELLAKGSGRFSDTSNFSVFALNGIGASASLQFQYGNDVSVFNFEALDLGFVSWNEQSLHVTMDTTVKYDGREIGDIGGGGKIDLDSLIKYTGADVSQQKTGKMLYPRFRFSYSHRFENARWVLGVGVEYQLGTLALPLGYAKMVYRIDEIQMAIEGNVSYGGYGGFNMGAGIQKRFADRINVLAGTNSLISLFAPSTYPGFSFYVGLGVEF